MKYMCTTCFSQFDEDLECYNCYSKERLVEIDDLICPIICILNKKGYKTISSCSGHNDNYRHNKTYISFEKDSVPDVLPDGFSINDNHINKTVIYKVYNKMNKDELEENIMKTFMILLNWIMSLKNKGGI